LEAKILIFFWEKYIFGNRGGSGGGLGTQNIGFPLGKFTFLEPEEGLVVAWERKILAFLWENVHFWKQRRVWWWPGNAKY